MGTDIFVDLNEIDSAKEKLDALYKKMANRKLVINFQNSKGELAKELLDTASKLNEINAVISTLVNNTHNIVTNTRASFKKADTDLAKYFRNGD